MSLRVGFTLVGGRAWTGGRSYLLNLFRVLCSTSQPQVVPVLLVDVGVAEEELAVFRGITGVEVHRTPVLAQNRRSKLLLRCLLSGRDPGFESLLEATRVDVVFEAAQYFGWRLSRPAIAWIPDLQHRFLPALFSRWGWWRRELGLRLHLWTGRHVMVSSSDTLTAFLRLYPVEERRITAVRFALPPGPAIPEAEARAVADRYGLPERYFFMPNQFWVHKNHLLVVEALGLLRASGHHITVVAPGLQFDPRRPGHFAEVKARVEATGVRREFLMPGLVPYEDLGPLMQASVALLNPSLFEGWSTTVEEARSQGVPLLLSDLDVHREQAGSDARYFSRADARSLADALVGFAPLTPPERRQRREAAAHDAEHRVARFADEFRDLVGLVARSRVG